jgi:hypothetical protein
VGAEGPDPGHRKLAPLVIAPTLSVLIDGDKSTPAPALHAQGDKYLVGDPEKSFSLLFQGRADLNGRPAAGTDDDVASRIKLSPGNLNIDLGVRASWFAASDEKDAGTFGVDVRLGATAAYQTADALTTTGDVDRGNFGLFSAQATVALWLWYAYVGAQANYYVSTGESLVSDALNKTTGLSVTGVIPVRTGDDEHARTFYLQFSGGGDSHDFTTSFSVTAEFARL